MNPIALKKLRELDLEAPTSEGRQSHLSAASGLVIVNSIAYVVADDEQHLGVFSLTNDGPGKCLRVLEGHLPDDMKLRKKAKADLEALVLLPAFGAYRYPVLFAIGSGSKRHRRRGVLLPLDGHGIVAGPARSIDLEPFFAPIERLVDELNIEGAVIVNDHLQLLQRGNKGAGINAVVSLSLNQVLQSLAGSDQVDAVPFTLRQYNLGTINGIPLGFTDGAALPDGRIVFTAVAENSTNAFDDGPCAAAAVGILAADGQLQRLEQLTPNAKVEGVDARITGRGIQLHFVSDADDASIAASLYFAELR